MLPTHSLPRLLSPGATPPPQRATTSCAAHKTTHLLDSPAAGDPQQADSPQQIESPSAGRQPTADRKPTNGPIAATSRQPTSPQNAEGRLGFPRRPSRTSSIDACLAASRRYSPGYRASATDGDRKGNLDYAPNVHRHRPTGGPMPWPHRAFPTWTGW